MKFFRRLSLTTLIAVYLLIMVGGIVRTSGSGMGCPDWPKCFGNWVPPSSVEELPVNYKEVYASIREKKNLRFAKYLEALGFEQTAEKIRTDKSILEEADFNATKTWVEYINRIIGVIIGFLIFAVFVTSLKFWRWDRRVPTIAFCSFVLVGIQGWIGSIVVSTNLTPWTVTVHMFLALVIVALLVYLVYESKKDKYARSVKFGRVWIAICMLTLLTQVFFGTQVREAIDQVAKQFPRIVWMEHLGESFLLHRTFSWLVLVVHAFLFWKLRQAGGSRILPNAMAVLILCTILSGIGMAYFSVPAFLQPIHLTLATLTFGIQVLLALQVSQKGDLAMAE